MERKKRYFSKETDLKNPVRLLLYGFGDVPNPSTDTIDVMEDIILDYLTEMCHKAAKAARNRGRVKIDDFKFALRNDPKKLARVEELLYMHEDLRRARQAFDVTEVEPEKEK